MNASAIASWRAAGPNLARVVALTAAGLALRVGHAGHAELVPIAFVVIFAALHARPVAEWAAGGALAGLVFASAMLVGLAKWGVVPMLALWWSVGAAFALFFAVVGVLAARVDATWRPPVIAAAWCAAILLLDRFVYAPVLLTAPLAFEFASYRAVVASVGVAAAEGLVVLATAGIAAAWRQRRALLFVAPLAVVVVASGADTVAPTGRGVLHAIQPNFTWAEYASRAWSLEARAGLAETLDRMTREAALRGPGTVLWPENGSGVADAQLGSRQRALFDAIDGTESDLVTAGLYYEGEGRSVAAVHVTRDGLGAVTKKSKLVPIAEADVTPGEPEILVARAGALGVSICFDVLFGDHVRDLVARGADVLAVTSDNASFGPSLLPEWHAAYAVLRAAESRRSMLFASNRGPALAYDVGDGSVRRLTDRGERTIATVSLTRTDAPSRDARHVVAALLLAAPLLLAWVGARTRERTAIVQRRFLAAALLSGVVVSPLVELAHVAARRDTNPVAIAREAMTRGLGARGVDVLPSHFVQSQPRSCGRAALAYAMTVLGDRVFEEAFDDVALDEDGASLSDLVAASRARGFTAEALRATSLDALELRAGRVALLHLERGHYVVVTRADADYIAFDPASGAVQVVDVEALTERWSGAALRLAIGGQGASQPSYTYTAPKPVPLHPSSGSSPQ